MGRILAIDYGDKRTGLAVTDPLRIVPGALDTIPTSELVDYLAKYIAANDVETIVVGWPTRPDGRPSASLARVRPLVERLRKTFPTQEVVCYDERYTSMLAHRVMIEGGVPRMQRRDKGLVDRISASILLGDYLESVKNKK